MFKETKFMCLKCGDLVYSSYPGQFVSCKCGRLSVDETEYYIRILANNEDYIEVTDECS
jgi:hypothetical protein